MCVQATADAAAKAVRDQANAPQPVKKIVPYQVTEKVAYKVAVPQAGWTSKTDWVNKEELTGTSLIAAGQMTTASSAMSTPTSVGGNSAVFYSDRAAGTGRTTLSGAKLYDTLKMRAAKASQATQGSSSALAYQTQNASIQAQQKADQAAETLAKAQESKSEDDIKAAKKAIEEAETAANRLSTLSNKDNRDSRGVTAKKDETAKKKESPLNDLAETIESLRNSLQQVRDNKDKAKDKDKGNRNH